MIFLERLRQEWPVVKGAPLSFGIALSLCIVAGWGGIYFLFKGNLELKNDLLEGYEKRYGPPPQGGDTEHSEVVQSWEGYRKEEIFGKTFRNEEIIVDGKSFVNCRFDNVTFVYNGTAPWSFLGGEVSGVVRLHTDSAAVQATMEFLKMFRAINPDIRFEDNSTVTPLPIRPHDAPPKENLSGPRFIQ